MQEEWCYLQIFSKANKFCVFLQTTSDYKIYCVFDCRYSLIIDGEECNDPAPLEAMYYQGVPANKQYKSDASKLKMLFQYLKKIWESMKDCVKIIMNVIGDTF